MEPIHIISLGAGVQSSTMALMAAAGEITPMPTAAVFADTMAEPTSVYRWLDALEPKLPFPVIRVSKGDLKAESLRIREHQSKPGKFWAKSLIPAFVKNKDGTRGMMSRACTFDYKVRELEKASLKIARQWVLEWQAERRAWAAFQRGLFGRAGMHDELRHAARVAKELGELGQEYEKYPVTPPPAIMQWIGISLDESQRMKDARRPYIKHRWPLIELNMTRQDCLKWMDVRGLPHPPKSACGFCPFRSDNEWRSLARTDPEAFAEAIQFEKDLQAVKRQTDNMGGIPFLHSSLIPLGEVIFDTEARKGHMLAGFGNECEGLCGV